MSPTDWVAAGFLALFFLCVSAAIAGRFLADHRTITDDDFAWWARTTMLTVTDRQGQIHVSSIKNLYEDHSDLYWGTPVSVHLWQTAGSAPSIAPGSLTPHRTHLRVWKRRG